MRTPKPFLLLGTLLVAVAVVSFLYLSFTPDGDAPRGVVFFGSTMYPTFMGLVLLVAGFAGSLIGRTSWDRTPSVA